MIAKIVAVAILASSVATASREYIPLILILKENIDSNYFESLQVHLQQYNY